MDKIHHEKKNEGPSVFYLASITSSPSTLDLLKTPWLIHFTKYSGEPDDDGNETSNLDLT